MANVELAATADSGVSFATVTSVDAVGDGAIDHDLQIVSTRARPAPETWLRGITAWHQAGRHPVPMILDGALAFASVLWVTGSLRMTTVVTAVLCFAGPVFGIWKRRNTIESQGVSWFLLPLARTAITAGFMVRVAVPGATDRTALPAAVALFVSLAVARIALWQVIAAARRRGAGLRSTLVIGPAHRVSEIRRRLVLFPEAGLRFDAAYVPRPGDGETPESGRALVDDLLGRHSVGHVLYVADDADVTLFKDFVRFGSGRVECSIVPPLAHLYMARTRNRLGDLGIISVPVRATWGAAAAKRVFDLVGSIVLLVLLSPLLLVTALAIRLDSPGPIIFKQRRSGHGGRAFTIFKFRSMVVDADARADEYLSREVLGEFSFKFEMDPRVTRVGSVIRRLSIDELPQLLNVVKGDMSLVGPRPLPFDHAEFDVRAQIRYQVLPGITGLWQVSGANALGDGDMFELDMTYVITRSLGVDLLLLLHTIPALLVRRAPV